MSAAGASTAAQRAWAEGPEGAKDVVAYVNETPALYAIFLELHLLEQLEAEDDGSVAWDTIFTVANHWRENELARAAAPIDADQLAAVKDQCETGLQAEHECPAMFALASIYADLFVGETITPVPEAEAAADDRHTEVRRLHEAITRLAPQFGLPWKETWEQLTEAEKDCLALAIAEVFPPSGGWCIRHVDGRWRTMDSLGMPDWTDDPAKALCCRLREHVDAYAVDDPEDVRIVPALAISERLPQLGGTYATQDGGSVKMVGIHYAGTDNETLVDEVGVNRYSRRLFDGGRVTGTAHDYSHPGNLVRPIRALKLEMISAPSHVGQNADELIRELREWSQQHLAMTAIEIIEEAQALMSKAANALASTPSTTPQKTGELLTRDHDKSLKAAAQRLTLATGFQFDDCALDIQQVCQHALATPHVVAREHTVDIGEARLKLGYIVVNGWPTFPSAEAAIDFIKARDLPLGWVVMELEQLSARPAKLFAAPQEGAGSTAGPATNGEPAAAAPVSMTPRTDALAAKFQNERNDDLSGAYGEALDLCEQLETALPAIERELPPKITDAMIRALSVGIDLHVRGPAPARDLGVLHERYQKVWDMVLKAAPTCAVSATAAKRHWVFAAAEACRVAVNGMDSSRSSKYECSEHLNYMLDQIRDGGFSPTKACRWLGWVQACLYCNGVMPLEEAKEINRVAARALAAFNSNTNRSV